MNLLCPNCQNRLSVPEQNAGQLMKCSFCSKYFSVPALPQAGPQETGSASSFQVLPAPAPPGSPSVQPGVFPAPQTAAPKPLTPRQDEPSGGRSSPVQQPSPEPAPPPPPPTRYEHVFTIWISPRVVSWIAPVALFLVLILMFFPWTGVYPGGYAVYKQSALQMIWGGYSVDPVGDQVVRMENAIHGAIHANWLMAFYFLLILAALVLAATSLVQARTSYPLPPAFQKLLPWHAVLVVIATLLAFLILVRFLVGGSDFEKTVITIVDQSFAKEPATFTPEEQIERGLKISRLNLSRTFWLRCAVFFHVTALAGAGVELWLQRRGGRPLPRLEAHY